MDHDALMEIAASELAEALAQIEDRGACPECLAALLTMVVAGMRQEWPDSG